MSTRKRLKLGAIIFALGALVFVVASAYLVGRAWPTWLAGAVGAVAFPVLPVAWHIWAERKRRAKNAAAANVKAPVKRSSSSPADRFLFRMLGAAVLVIGPMIAVGRFDVVRATWHHGLWFVTGSSSSDADADLLARVPADAEVVVVFGSDVLPDARGGLLAWTSGNAMSAIDVAGATDPAPGGQPVAASPKLAALLRVPAMETLPGGPPYVAASPGWKAHVGEGASAAMRAELARAPAGTTVHIGLVARDASISRVVTAVAAWGTFGPVDMTLDARVVMTDPKLAALIAGSVRSYVEQQLASAPAACRAAAAQLLSRTSVTADGAVITVHALMPMAQRIAFLACFSG